MNLKDKHELIKQGAQQFFTLARYGTRTCFTALHGNLEFHCCMIKECELSEFVLSIQSAIR